MRFQREDFAIDRLTFVPPQQPSAGDRAGQVFLNGLRRQSWRRLAASVAIQPRVFSAFSLRIDPGADTVHQPQADCFVGRRLGRLVGVCLTASWRATKKLQAGLPQRPAVKGGAWTFRLSGKSSGLGPYMSWLPSSGAPRSRSGPEWLGQKESSCRSCGNCGFQADSTSRAAECALDSDSSRTYRRPDTYGTLATVGLSWRGFWCLFRRSFVLAYHDGCFGTAKGAAYSALLSFFPLLTVTATILVQANAEAITRILSQALFGAAPPGTQELVHQFTVRGQRPVSLLVVATLVSIWAASGLITSLMEGFDAAYHIPQGRSFLRQRGVAVLLVLTAALPAVAASAVILLGEGTEKTVMLRLGLVPAGLELRGWVRFGVALGTIVLVTAVLYFVGPNRPQRWGHVWPGAFLATALWLLATLGFAWYVRNIADYNLLYGSIGAVIALLVWMYLLAVIALVGCEFNAEYERMERPGG